MVGSLRVVVSGHAILVLSLGLRCLMLGRALFLLRLSSCLLLTLFSTASFLRILADCSAIANIKSRLDRYYVSVCVIDCRLVILSLAIRSVVSVDMHVLIIRLLAILDFFLAVFTAKMMMATLFVILLAFMVYNLKGVTYC